MRPAVAALRLAQQRRQRAHPYRPPAWGQDQAGEQPVSKRLRRGT
jgi:hypothetical protein